MRKCKRLLVMLLVAAMLVSLAVPVSAGESKLAAVTDITERGKPLALTEKVSQSGEVTAVTREPGENEIVPVIIELDGASAIDVQLERGVELTAAVEQTTEILMAEQESFARTVQQQGIQMDVQFHYTALVNGVGAEMRYGDLNAVRAIPGVLNVWVANTYALPAEQEPTMASANLMTGAANMWSGQFKGEGMVAAVLDTGLRTEHEAFQDYGMTDTHAALSAEFMRGFIAASKGKYLSEKVPFSYDYADKDDDVTDKNGHGTHVSGTVCGYTVKDNGEDSVVTFSGAAPAAQLLSMKIFGDAKPTTNSTIYFAALDDAYRLGADVINMSIGSPAGFSFDSELETEFFGNIYQKLDDAGVIVCNSAGNENSMAEKNLTGMALPTADYADYGLVGSPSTYAGNLSVASVENLIYPAYTVSVGEHSYEYIDNGRSAQEDHTFVANLAGEQQYVALLAEDGTPLLGQVADYVGHDVRGKIVLVSRGAISFSDKVKNAADAGAKGLIVFNNTTGTISMAITAYLIPAVSVTQAAGMAMIQALPESKVGVMTVNRSLSNVPNANGGLMSTFSSWGPTPDLKFKPMIAAPGGMIYSASYSEDSAYTLMSGTSMAAPNATGCMALLVQALRTQHLERSKQYIANLAESLVLSTATLVHTPAAEPGEPTLPVSPRKQGAGAISVYDASQAKGYVTHPLIELGDRTDGVYPIAFTVQNLTDTELSYTVDPLVMFDEPLEIDSNLFNSQTTADLIAQGYATAEFAETVTVPARDRAEVTVTVTLTELGKTELAQTYVNGCYIDGYIMLTEVIEPAAEPTVTPEVPVIPQQIHASFIGFFGDWKKGAALEANDWGQMLDGYADLAKNHPDLLALGRSPLDLHMIPNVNVGINEAAATYTKNGSVKYPYLGDNALDYFYHSNLRNAITTKQGDGFRNAVAVFPMQLRNAKEIGIEVVDAADNTKVYYTQTTWEVPKAGYDSDYGVYLSYVNYRWDGLDHRDAAKPPVALANNTQVTVNIFATLDYEGAVRRTEWHFPVVIDGADPIAKAVWDYNKPKIMTLTLSDNQFVMGAFVYDLNKEGKIGKTYYGQAFAEETAGVSKTVTVDLTNADTSKPLYIEVYDYANNYKRYEVSFGQQPPYIPTTPSVTYYSVTAQAGSGGRVAPESTRVAEGGSVKVTVTPNSGYAISNVTVDGKSVGPVASYTFEKVKANHTLVASFKRGATVNEWVNPFRDVNTGDWFYRELALVASGGMMGGVSADRFAPEVEVNRAMAATILYRMAGSPDVTGACHFTDVAPGAWYEKAVIWGYQNGIVEGMGEKTFSPLQSITREQLTLFLFRYAKYAKMDVTARADLSAYADGKTVSEWAKEAMSWAVGAGFLKGTGAGLEPAATATRAQLASIVARYAFR